MSVGDLVLIHHRENTHAFHGKTPPHPVAFLGVEAHSTNGESERESVRESERAVVRGGPSLEGNRHRIRIRDEGAAQSGERSSPAARRDGPLSSPRSPLHAETAGSAASPRSSRSPAFLHLCLGLSRSLPPSPLCLLPASRSRQANRPV